MSKDNFECHVCDGAVRMVHGPGRTYPYRSGLLLPVPDGLGLSTCQHCGEQYLNSQEAEQLEQALSKEFVVYCRELVATVCERANVSVRELEDAAAVRYGHLAKLRDGGTAPSFSLVRLLQAFAIHPSEVQRHRSEEDYRAVLAAQSSPCPNTST